MLLFRMIKHILVNFLDSFEKSSYVDFTIES